MGTVLCFSQYLLTSTGAFARVRNIGFKVSPLSKTLFTDLVKPRDIRTPTREGRIHKIVSSNPVLTTDVVAAAQELVTDLTRSLEVEISISLAASRTLVGMGLVNPPANRTVLFVPRVVQSYPVVTINPPSFEWIHIFSEQKHSFGAALVPFSFSVEYSGSNVLSVSQTLRRRQQTSQQDIFKRKIDVLDYRSSFLYFFYLCFRKTLENIYISDSWCTCGVDI
jgi:hypothetical protein